GSVCAGRARRGGRRGGRCGGPPPPPPGATGPNAMACTGCHNQGGDDGGGEAADNVHRDANHTRALNQMVERNTPSVLGLGGLQKLAEEMTTDIQNLRNTNRTAAGCGANTTAATR